MLLIVLLGRLPAGVPAVLLAVAVGLAGMRAPKDGFGRIGTVLSFDMGVEFAAWDWICMGRSSLVGALPATGPPCGMMGEVIRQTC